MRQGVMGGESNIWRNPTALYYVSVIIVDIICVCAAEGSSAAGVSVTFKCVVHRMELTQLVTCPSGTTALTAKLLKILFWKAHFRPALLVLCFVIGRTKNNEKLCDVVFSNKLLCIYHYI